MKISSGRIMIIGVLLIVQLILWGMITGNISLVWLGVVNILIAIGLGGRDIIAYLIHIGVIQGQTRTKFKKYIHTFIIHGGFVVLVTVVMRYGVKAILDMHGRITFVGMGFLLGMVGWNIRESLSLGNINRGHMRMQPYHRWILFSVVVGSVLFLRTRHDGSSSYLMAIGVGFILFTLGLVVHGEGFKSITRHTGWILYASLTGIILLRTVAQSTISRFDSRTFESVTVEEKETVVYVVTGGVVNPIPPTPAEDVGEQDEEEVEILSGTQDNTIEGNKEEEITEQDVCPEDSCFWEDRCVETPLYASCTEGGDDAWICDEGYEEIDLLCYQLCSNTECRIDQRCVQRPEKAYCVETGTQGWRCEGGYTQQGTDCVRVIVSPISPQSQEDDPIVQEEININIDIDVDDTSRVDIGSFINPPSLLEKAQQQSSQNTDSDRILDEDTSQQSVIEKKIDQALSPVTRLIQNN